MFDATPMGPSSPSSSLLVERRDIEPISWQSHLLEDQLFHFFMKPAVIGFSLKDAAIARIPLAPGQAVFCPRKEWHNIRWDERISVLSIRILDSALMEAARERLTERSLEIVPRQVVTDDRLTTRSLERQISTLYYERLLATSDRPAVENEARVNPAPSQTPRDFVRDPVMLEFLGLPGVGRLLEADLEEHCWTISGRFCWNSDEFSRLLRDNTESVRNPKTSI
jgi:hypothetical protein